MIHPCLSTIVIFNLCHFCIKMWETVMRSVDSWFQGARFHLVLLIQDSSFLLEAFEVFPDHGVKLKSCPSHALLTVTVWRQHCWNGCFISASSLLTAQAEQLSACLWAWYRLFGHKNSLGLPGFCGWWSWTKMPFTWRLILLFWVLVMPLTHWN